MNSIKVEGGTLDGFQQTLHPGLNVFIGGRGTGKSSVIELIRFGLGAPTSSDTIAKETLEHALGVLGDGKVTITIADGTDRVEVSRIASDNSASRPLDLSPPLIFSQKEIEQIGGRPHSRLRLLDGFIEEDKAISGKSAPLISRIHSLSAEIRNLLAEIDEISDKLLVLPERQEKLAELQRRGIAETSRSVQLEPLRNQLDALTPHANAANVRVAALERSAEKLFRWTADLTTVAERSPLIEPWPAEAGPADQLLDLRNHQAVAQQRLQELY